MEAMPAVLSLLAQAWILPNVRDNDFADALADTRANLVANICANCIADS